MAQYLVVGMGKFGRSIASTLYKNGQTVLAIDTKENLIQEAIDDGIVYDGIVMDAKDETSLKKIVEGSFDTAFVCIGTNVQDSILITVTLKDMGINNIIAKATTKVHGKVLEKVGATRVIYPEEEMGSKIAFSVLNPNIIEYLKFSDGYSIIEIKVPKSFIGKTLLELDLRKKYDANIIAIKDENEQINSLIGPNTILNESDMMVVFGDIKKIKNIVEN